jgi:hypothetical protein
VDHGRPDGDNEGNVTVSLFSSNHPDERLPFFDDVRGQLRSIAGPTFFAAWIAPRRLHGY